METALQVKCLAPAGRLFFVTFSRSRSRATQVPFAPAHQPLVLRHFPCSCQDLAAMDALLQAGARPASSPAVAATVARLAFDWDPATWDQLLPPLLQHGLDPLGPAGWPPQQQFRGRSLLATCFSQEACRLMLAHLEAQRAAGTLQLGSKQRCCELLLGACRSSEPPQQLVQWAISQLQQLIDGAHAAAGGEDAASLDNVWLAAAQSDSAVVLAALLASQLPRDLAAVMPNGSSLLTSAAGSPQTASCVRLLIEAGAVPTVADLYAAVDGLSPGGVAALLAGGAPVFNASQPTAFNRMPGFAQIFGGWSCPIHRTLHNLVEASWRQRAVAAPTPVHMLQELCAWFIGYVLRCPTLLLFPCFRGGGTGTDTSVLS